MCLRAYLCRDTVNASSLDLHHSLVVLLYKFVLKCPWFICTWPVCCWHWHIFVSPLFRRTTTFHSWRRIPTHPWRNRPSHPTRSRRSSRSRNTWATNTAATSTVATPRTYQTFDSKAKGFIVLTTMSLRTRNSDDGAFATMTEILEAMRGGGTVWHVHIAWVMLNAFSNVFSVNLHRDIALYFISWIRLTQVIFEWPLHLRVMPSSSLRRANIVC